MLRFAELLAGASGAPGFQCQGRDGPDVPWLAPYREAPGHRSPFGGRIGHARVLLVVLGGRGSLAGTPQPSAVALVEVEERSGIAGTRVVGFPK